MYTLPCRRVFRTLKRHSSLLPGLVHQTAARRTLVDEIRDRPVASDKISSAHSPGSGVTPASLDPPAAADSRNGVVGMDVQKMDRVDRYRLLCAAIVPRPIAFVSTCSKDRVYNLASFSFFMPVTSEPPSLAFSITRKKDDHKKDTLVNIEETKHFVVNHLSLPIFNQAYSASQEFPPDVDEFEAVGLTAMPTLYGPAPRILESPLALECSLLKLVSVGDEKYGASTLVLGQLLHAYVEETCIEGNSIRPEGLRTVSRLGGMNYGEAERILFTVQNDGVWSHKHW